jgi:hypothetical protein
LNPPSDDTRIPDWSSVATWRVPRSRISWHAATAWATTFDRVVDVSARRLADVIGRWDLRLADIGGDPARADWSAFRPLRITREEDWSDWLAHLLEQSRSGRFPARVFSGDAAEVDRWRVARAHREVSAEQYRADLLIQFHDEEWAHLEVKVGDLALAKTPDTGEALRREKRGVCRGDFLLLPEEDLAVWEAISSTLGKVGAQTQALTWHDIARALRSSVIEVGTEPQTWRVWALTLLGAIEQLLLGFPPVPANSRGAHLPSPRDLARLDFLASVEPR